MRKRLIAIIVVLSMILVGCIVVAINISVPPNKPVGTPIGTTCNTEPVETTAPIELSEPSQTETLETRPIEVTQPAPVTFNIKMSFAGDAMLASYKNQTTEGSFNDYVSKREPSYFLEKVRPVFENDDFTIVNLENVFTDKNLSPVEKDHDPAYWYRSQTSNVNILTCSSVEGVSLANNHTYDYGETGRKDTVSTVVGAGLQYGRNEHIMYFEKEGFTVAVICSGLWGEWQAEDIIKLINTAEEKSDYQVVFYHGGKEKIHQPEDWKIRASRKLVDNGADLVIGNHPHVLQPREIYNGVEIIYSIGNFCYGGSRSPENRTIIYQMTLTIDNDNKAVLNSESTIIPCYVYTAQKNNYQPAPIDDVDIAQRVIDFIDGKAESPL